MLTVDILGVCEEFTMWHFATNCASIGPSYVDPECSRRYGESHPAGHTLEKVTQRSSGGWVELLHLRPGLVWSQQKYLRLLLTVRYLSHPRAAARRPSSEEKRGGATLQSGRFGLVVSVSRHVCRDISVHKQLITRVGPIRCGAQCKTWTRGYSV